MERDSREFEKTENIVERNENDIMNYELEQTIEHEESRSQIF